MAARRGPARRRSGGASGWRMGTRATRRRCARCADGRMRLWRITGKAFEAHALALSFDPMCYEAYEAVLATHMLSEEEERFFVASLDGHEDDAWIRDVYVVMGNSREVDSELARGRGRGVERHGVDVRRARTAQAQRRRSHRVCAAYVSAR